MRLLGIEHPIVQAPIGGAAVPELAAAVSNAGALGMLALSWANDAGAHVRETAALTARPFGANFVLEWDQHPRVDAALEAGLRIVSLTWGDPAPYVARVHDAGALLLHTVGSAEEAKRATDAGVDVVVAQGWEAGGHVAGRVATLPLVPAVVDAVSPTPVIAAGGIGDARGVAAVLALGAQAAWLGTRFLLAEEAFVHERYRARLAAAVETDAEWYADLYDVGWPNAPHRALRNSTAEAWEAAGRPAPGTRPGEGEAIATSARGDGSSATPRRRPSPPWAERSTRSRSGPARASRSRIASSRRPRSCVSWSPGCSLRTMERAVKVACAQAEPVILNLGATLDKLESIAAEAAGNGAELVVFPETFVSIYPSSRWAKAFAGWHSPGAKETFARIAQSSVAVGSPAELRLAAAAKALGIWIVTGVNEVDPERAGTIYNALLYHARPTARSRSTIASSCRRITNGSSTGRATAAGSLPWRPASGGSAA